MMCIQCPNDATGTAWLSYHEFEIMAVSPVCLVHNGFYESRSSLWQENRPYGYLPGMVTNNIMVVDDIVSKIYKKI